MLTPIEQRSGAGMTLAVNDCFPSAITAAKSLPAPAAGQGGGTLAEQSVPVHMPVQLCTDCPPIDLWNVVGFVLLWWVGHFMILGINECRAGQGDKK